MDIGICGCGFIGRIHARAYKAMPGMSIRAVFDSFDALLTDERSVAQRSKG